MDINLDLDSTVAQDFASASAGRQRRRSGPRRKTGCYTCKSRHTHCDERKPVCRNCERLNLPCRQFEFIVRSTWCDVPTVEEENETENTAETSPTDVSSSNIASTTEATSPTTSVAVPSTSYSSDSSPPDSTTTGTTAKQTPLPLSGEVAHLLSVYATGLATWMDIFDHGRAYQREVPIRCLTSALLTKCVCAFTAKRLSQLPSGEIWSARAAHYYGDSLRLLIQDLDNNNNDKGSDALTANMLLSSYEMLDARAHEHQRHLHGASTLIRMRGIDGQSPAGSMDATNFWIYVRHDITIALENETPLQFPPDEWNVDFKKGEMDEDALANQLMWLTARAVHLIYGPQQQLSSSIDWALEDIHREALAWFDNLPISFQAVTYGETTDIGFTKTYVSLPAAAAALMWYHLLFILLGAETSSQYPSRVYQIQNHAIEITNIAVSEITDSVRGFSGLPLFFAAKHISGIGRKTKLWAMLDDLEVRFGLRTRGRVQKLQQMVDDSSPVLSRPGTAEDDGYH